MMQLWTRLHQPSHTPPFITSSVRANLPYTHHLADVENILQEFAENRLDLLTAAWLHDIVEDTDVKVRDVRRRTSENVSQSSSSL